MSPSRGRFQHWRREGMQHVKRREQQGHCRSLVHRILGRHVEPQNRRRTGGATSSGSGGVPYRPGRSCHVVLKLKHREERISPSLLDAELHRHCGSPTRSVSNGDPAPLKRGHESGRVGGDTPGGFGPPPRCAGTPPLSAFSRTCCRADRARRSSSRPGVESRRSRASRAGSRAYRHPAVAAEELVAHGQIRVQDRANLRRARGVE